MPDVRFSTKAEADIDDIAAFSVDRFGTARTRLYLRNLREACNRLGDFPAMAPFHPRIDPPVRVLSHRSHRISYRLVDDGVLILRILHQARDTPTSL